MTLLDERELTADERAAIADEARPGAWIEEDLVLAKINNPNIISQRTGRPIPPIRPPSGVRGDGRALDQEQTDQLVVLEVMRTMPEWRPMIRELVAPGQLPPTWIVNVDGALAEQQRGGIHSDPLVRLLAYRAWGDRDRRWRKRDTAKAMGGSIIDKEDKIDAWRRAYGFDGVALYHQELKRRTLYEASRDGRHASADFTFDQSLEAELSGPDSEDDLILDAFDTIDAKLAAGVNEPSQGPTFELG